MAALVRNGNDPNAVWVMNEENRKRETGKMKLSQRMHALYERKTKRLSRYLAQSIPYPLVKIKSELFIVLAVKRRGGLSFSAGGFL